MTEKFTRVADAIRAFERGEIVVVTDDDDRENEGDLIVAANHATPEKIAFIVRHTSGILCAPMTRGDAERFNLTPMVSDNNAPLSTAFTVSVDVRHGLTTGISAEERCNTVRALANGNSGPSDFVRPGHVFPLIARDGGVLMRSGHTEAAVDLCKLAGLPAVGAICELVNDDGTVKRGEQVAAFAAEHKLQSVSVADLIAWRQRTERLVERIGEAIVETPIGPAQAVSYRTRFEGVQHLALIFGDIRDGESIPARLQREAILDDVFGKDRPIERIMERIGEAKRGVIVYLRDGSAGVSPTSDRPRQSAGLDEGHDTARQRDEEWREIGLGAQILRDLGVSSIRLLASRERHYVGLGGFGITIDATEILDDRAG
ncbi:3,4-dihydroxy-2-butanone-4-phosphate synthase [Amorphus sp. 3PC139-8]|uniref:3,4-dihydroxy-2-butanone-4-phosphate synthase n=1 Tax=Amorphus sp. 3PC139-8 TaxID=2735676 RepID=UPI00345D1B56